MFSLHHEHDILYITTCVFINGLYSKHTIKNQNAFSLSGKSFCDTRVVHVNFCTFTRVYLYMYVYVSNIRCTHDAVDVYIVTISVFYKD